MRMYEYAHPRQGATPVCLAMWCSCKCEVPESSDMEAPEPGRGARGLRTAAAGVGARVQPALRLAACLAAYNTFFIIDFVTFFDFVTFICPRHMP